LWDRELNPRSNPIELLGKEGNPDSFSPRSKRWWLLELLMEDALYLMLRKHAGFDQILGGCVSCCISFSSLDGNSQLSLSSSDLALKSKLTFQAAK
jgi:hypothetical protein